MPKEKPPGTLFGSEYGCPPSNPGGDLLHSKCKLAVLAIGADGNSWADFSKVLAEGDGDSSLGLCKMVSAKGSGLAFSTGIPFKR